jgi:hypothetical protein
MNPGIQVATATTTNAGNTTTVDGVNAQGITYIPNVTPTQTDVKEVKKVNTTEVLRELSKTFSVSLFDEGGLQALKDKLAIQENEKKTLHERVDELSKKELLLIQKEQDYQVKIDALGLGFSSDSLDEVIALAKINAKDGSLLDGLKAVKTKYGSVFVNTADIGTQHNDLQGKKPDVAKSEQERYLSQSKAVQQYQRQQQRLKK